MRKNLILVLFLAVALTLVAGCTKYTPEEQSQKQNQQPGEAVSQTEEGEEQGAENIAYKGNWQRQATYVNDNLEHQEPASMLLGEETFVSKAECTISGELDVDQDNKTMTMTVDSSDCPGYTVPNVTEYNYELSNSNNTLTVWVTLSGTEVKEVY